VTAGQQRPRSLVEERTFALLDNVVDYSSVLLAQRRSGRQHPLDEAASMIAVRSEAGLPEDDGGPESPLRGIVRRLDTGDTHERPERLSVFPKIAAGRLDLRLPARTSAFEQRLDRCACRSDLALELGSRQGPVSNTMPMAEDLLPYEHDEHLGDLARSSTVLREALEGPKQMRPAELSLARRVLRVGVSFLTTIPPSAAFFLTSIPPLARSFSRAFPPSAGEVAAGVT